MSFLFGGGSSAVEKFKPVGINAGGLTGVVNKKDATVTSSAERQNLVGQISATFPQLASEIATQRAQVTPGFGELTRSRLAEIESARQRSIGNLAQNLQSRRVLGSSFGQDALIRAEREFTQEAEKAKAESFLQELEMNNQLLQQEFEARRGEFQTQLDELNLQAEVGTQLASQATAQLGENARLQAQLDAQSAAGFGQLLGLGLNLVTGGMGGTAATGAGAALNAVGYSGLV